MARAAALSPRTTTWSLLAQPSPLPERLITSAPDAVVDDALDHWSARRDVFGADIRSAYADALRDPVRAHAICEDYRAADALARFFSGDTDVRGGDG